MNRKITIFGLSSIAGAFSSHRIRPRRRGLILAQETGGQSAKRGGTFALAIIALIIAIVLGGAALGMSLLNYTSMSTNNSTVSNLANTVSSNYNALKGSISTVNGSLSSLSSVNVAPSTLGVKLQWCTQVILQDRFCPDNIVAVQGDIVQIFFMQNDTAAHTFTMLSPYNFQINDSGAGELDFLNDYAPLSAGCSNSGTYAQESAAVSGTYCVSGTSLLSIPTLTAHGANDFAVGQNPTPQYPFTPNGQFVSGEPSGTQISNPGPILVPVDNTAHMLSLSISGVGVNATGGSETQGIGAFQASIPGVFEFFCNYHVSNGMYGYLLVIPNAYCNTHAAACNLNNATLPS